jgi:uncharacterized protein Yka (UPF0111/DUF47 family)
MAFPQDAEETIRREILTICQENARNVVEISRKLALIFESKINGKDSNAEKDYNELLKLMEQFEENKKKFLRDVATAGSLLVNREAFLMLIFKLNEITDGMEGVAFRLLNYDENRWKAGKKYLIETSKISSSILEEVSKMRETLLSLSFNPSRALEMAGVVEKIEKDVDAKYRKLIGEVLDSKMPVQALLILKDIIERLERIADLTVDAIDLIRLLAISS